MGKEYLFILTIVATVVSFAKLMSTIEKSDLMTQNIEALTQSGESKKYGYNPSSGPCPYPSYKTWIFCGQKIFGGKEDFCMNSDC